MDAIELPQQTPKIPTRPWPVETRIKARADYVQGRGSCRAIAVKYGVPLETVRNWLDAEDWTGLRDEYERRQLRIALGPDIPAVVTPEVQHQPGSSGAQIERLKAQIQKIEEMMDETSDADELSKLSMAHSRLFESYCVLAGIQRPGVRKQPRRPSVSSLTASPEPQAIDTQQPAN